jgi:hypothetical protein
MIQKPRVYIADLTQLPRALGCITKEMRWVVWRWELRTRKNSGPKWTKPPYHPAFPKMSAKSNTPSTWGTYQEALATVAAGLADGIGFMLKDSEIAAADLDHVRNAETGELLDWAQRLCVEADSFGLYREVTVSGCGLRFIGLSSRGSELHRKFIFNRKSGAGIELYRNCARYITISGLQEGSCESMGPIGDYLDELMDRFGGQPPAPVAVLNDFFDFNTAGEQADYYRDIIENGAPEGERSEKFQEVVWHLASLGWTPEQIVDELAKYPKGIALKYTTRLLAEVTRSFGKWQSQRRTAATGSATFAPNSAATPWPQIKVRPSELPRVVNEAEDALLLLGREIYQRGGMLMRPVLSEKHTDDETEGWHLIPLTRPYLVETLCCAAQFVRFNGRSKAWTAIDAPDKVADSLLSRRGKWRLPVLKGIVQTPFLRADGSICETPGYDAASRLLFKAGDQTFPAIPQQPSRAEAVTALKVIEELISTFPFVAKADQSVALAALFTIIDRRSMATAPLFAFNSPVAGTGKSKLVDVCSILATGQ